MTVVNDHAPATADEGRLAAAVVYVLYLLSIPSVFTFLIVGLVIAYVMRGGSSGWVRTHFDRQVRIGWAWTWWTIGLTIAAFIGFVLAFIVVGLPIWAGALFGIFVLTLWLMVVSLLGLMRLMSGRPT